MNGDDKEDGTRQRRRWNATWHFLGKECHGRQYERRWMVTTKKMDGDDGQDIKRDMAFFGESFPWTAIRKRWMVTTKKMERDNGEEGTRHGIFWGKSAIDGNKKEMNGDDKEDEW